MTEKPGTDRTTCMACRLTSGTEHLPGGTVHRTALWVVEHCVGPLGLGTLVVKPLRHVLHIADLTPPESAELGPLLRRVAAAVTAVTRPEQVYICLWSHAGAVPHEEAVVDVCERMRAELDVSGAWESREAEQEGVREP
ncbi:HIT family protein [Streptomyces umbrinus]